MQNRSKPYQTAINAALAHADHGIPFDRLVNLVAAEVDVGRAVRFRLSSLKRQPSETTAQTQWKGQEALARKYIDAAHRNGRITYLEERGQRRVFPGDPASTGGRHAKRQTWQQEAARVHDSNA